MSPSKYLRDIVISWGVSASRVRVVLNSIQPQAVDNHSQSRKDTIRLSPYILAAARLVSWKGVDTVIAVWPELLNNYPDLKLVIAGSGPEELRLKKAVQKLGMEKAVSFSVLNAAAMARLMASAKAFILNSGYEGLSHSVIEAMSAGTPCLASDIGGNREVIQHEVNGLLFPYNDGPAIVATIDRIMTNHKLRQSIQDEARNTASLYTNDTMVEQTRHILCQTINEAKN